MMKRSGLKHNRCPQFFHGILLQLSDSLRGYVVALGQFVQSGFFIGQPAAGKNIQTAAWIMTILAAFTAMMLTLRYLGLRVKAGSLSLSQ